jgi:hypothetical protein
MSDGTSIQNRRCAQADQAGKLALLRHETQSRVFKTVATQNSSLFRWWRRAGSRHLSGASPVVIGGCQRSGTTLLRVILDSHPHFACGPESSLFPGSFLPEKLAPRFGLTVEEVWGLHREARDHAHFIELFFSRYSSARGRARWAEKTPQNVRHFDYVLRHFPKARLVHIVRDGRDAVCSIRTHPKFRMVDGQQTPTGIRRPIVPCIRSWVQDTAAGLRWRGHTSYLELRYEDLLDAPEQTLRRLCGFIREDFDPAMLEYYKDQGQSRDVTHFIVNTAATQPLSKASVERWREDMSPPELETFYRRAGRLLDQLGYDRPGRMSAAATAAI